MNDNDDLWAAYLAGFEISGEGWNGEYPHEVRSIEADVREKFEQWLVQREGQS